MPKKVKKDIFPLLPTRDIVPIPGLILPLQIAQGPSTEALFKALSAKKEIVLALDVGEGRDKDICSIGALTSVVHMVKFSNDDVKIRFQVQKRVKIVSFVKEAPLIEVEIEPIERSSKVKLNAELESAMAKLRERFAGLGQYEPVLEDYIYTAEELFDPGELSDLVATALPLKPIEAQRVLEELVPAKRLDLVASYLNAHLDSISIRERAASQAQNELTKAHHQELLREQMRQIQAELGEEPTEGDELATLEKQLLKLKMPPGVKKEAERQLRRLRQLHPDTSEAALARTYLDWITDLPWAKRTTDRLDLKSAREVLDADHFGLEKTKERILDFLGVRKLKKDTRGPVLLLVGPPGVGKTSLGRSIAKALGRQFVRVSLGGLRDEAELRGHRRTYVGALPGRIVQGLKTAGSKNPVFMLDEMDKVGNDYRGDPASVLLEILDPEQNKEFEDHYLNVPVDLSEVMFICTANVTDTVPAPLLDRMEVIEIAGYTTEEKLEIAKRYLIPRATEENGIADRSIQFSDQVLTFLVSGYTRESGVREFGRVLSTVCRKIARLLAEEKSYPQQLTEKNIEEFLGPVKYVADKKQARDEVGVVTGLAWTPVGGEVLTVEASLTPGKGSLSLTGQLGDVMRESAMTALTYLLSNAQRFGFDAGFYENSSIHIHVPHGAIPKDGPSAGVAMATALLSLLTGRAVSRDVSMTGEITLRGSVLPIGGLKEKALAALRAGIPTVIIPKENARELVEFPDYLMKQVKFVVVENLDQVFEAALLEGTKRPFTSRPGQERREKRFVPPTP